MTRRKPLTENSKAVPLDPAGPSPSENSRIHAATHLQSDVTPEDYPADERKAQAQAATGERNPGKP